MRIKDKTLIKYFRKRNITKENFEKTGNNIFLDYSKGLIDTEEVLKILEEFSDVIDGLSISGADIDTAKMLLSRLPENKIERIFIETPSSTINLASKDFSRCPNLEDVNFRSNNQDFVVENLEIPENVKNVHLSASSVIQDLKISTLGEKPNISIYGVKREDIENISEEVAEKIDQVGFQCDDKYFDLVSIGMLLEKFKNLKEVIYPPKLDIYNLGSLTYITEMVEKCGSIFVGPKTIKEYKGFYERKYGDKGLDFSFTSGKVFSKKERATFENRGIYIGTELSQIDDFSKFKDISPLKFLVDSMVDIPLEIAEKLQKEGIKCSIQFDSYDNKRYQNSTYSLDEYVVMRRKMEEIVGDIDINLPEEEKFKQIYTRVITHLEYDDAAVEPRTRQEKKYSIDNDRDCRNLKNALITGKTVCAGYADVFKNACLLKGIECEYFNGPIDILMSRVNYLQKADEEKEIVYSDDKDVISRKYHAWNKVKINGIWYNCDPTWDRIDVLNNRVPKYALISDEIYKSSGRPTTAILRHPCHTTVSSKEKEKIFKGFEPAENFYIKNKLMEFENSLDENGNPRQLPVVPKETLWAKIIRKLRKISGDSKQKLENESIPLVNKDNETTKKASWELTKEQLEEIARKKRERESKAIKTNESQKQNNDYELGDR